MCARREERHRAVAVAEEKVDDEDGAATESATAEARAERERGGIGDGSERADPRARCEVEGERGIAFAVRDGGDDDSQERSRDG